MKPLNNKILLRKVVRESTSGLIMINTNSDKILTCEVLAIPKEETEIQLMNTVLVPADRVAEVPEGLVVDRKDILGILE